MSIPGSAAPFLLAQQPVEEGYFIERSLRFNSSDSAYLSRTPASAGNRKTWTWAGWVKRSNLTDAYNTLFSATAASYFAFQANGTLLWYEGSTLITAQLFRDASAWYHIVLAYDSTQATASDRIKVYVNGAQVTSFSAANYPAQNTDSAVNSTGEHNIGKITTLAGTYLSGYLADIHFIDGQALDPTSFGEFDDNGIWQPIAYSGSYGTNGFHLDFADNSTAAALGTDTSGNGNDWTVNNITAVAPSYSSPTNANTPVYDITIGPTNPLSGVGVWSDAFNGDSNTYGIIGPITFINTKPTWSTSTGVELMASGNGITASVNGGSQVALANNAFVTISSGSSGTLNSIWIYNSAGSSSIKRVRVDGVDISVRALLSSASDIDSLVDVPTNGTETDTGVGGEVRGNYCTLNPVVGGANSAQITFANGNLEATWDTTVGYAAVLGTIGVSTGKWYWETTIANVSALFGVATGSSSLTQYIGGGASSYGYYSVTGATYNNATPASYGDTYTTGDVIGIALDLDNGKLYFSKNGTWQNSGSPTGGTGEAYSGLTGTFFPAYAEWTSPGATSYIVNFGQRPFAYTAPSGFKALCTANLPAPVVTKPSEYMDVALYTGNGSTQTISGLEFSPDLVWGKERGGTASHVWMDVIRGTGVYLRSDTANGDTPNANVITSFNSDGFTLGTSSALNASTDSYAAWCWDAGSSTVTNTDGSITSSVRANPSAGFSIVTYTGNGVTGGSVGHGLGVTPGLIIVKQRSTTVVNGNWNVWHRSLVNAGNYLVLNEISTPYSGGWNSTLPTSQVFSLTNFEIQNNLNSLYVAYCFAPVDGYSSFGSYTGNGSADGPFVFTNMRPRWILIKRTDTTSNWIIIDTAREGYNVDNDPLFPNTSGPETTADLADILSNGFKLRSTDASVNASAGTYIYATFAEATFSIARAR